MSSQMTLEYNMPLNVPEDFSAVANPTTQADSVLQIENLSTSNTLQFYVNAGAFTYQGQILANTADPYVVVHNFNGAALKITNISTRSATAKVTLKST
ncbi:hypothetical protein V6582_20045 [Agrobacterium vitis]|uniref:hypothetical protein n=1 Tax=Agrobacterium vitis TaxID=373 RepID=UPI0012E70A85|nr:hypothetical protein [Agrobacterium vitis]MVA26945.1 hypothetical protein [Agrobacterium vitis]